MTRLLYLPDDTTVIQMEVEISAHQLCAAVNAGMRPLAVLRGTPAGKLIANVIGGSVIVSPLDAGSNPVKNNPKTQSLSRRQRQVHELSARGLSSGEIAVMLRLSRRTVNYHLSQARNRLRVADAPRSSMSPLSLKFDESD